MRIWTLLLVGACASTARPPQPQPGVAVDFEVGEIGRESRDQPPEVKLVLGHYTSHRLGLGLVIDRTSEKLTKVRFDGTRQTIALTPRYFWHRTEFHRTENDKLIVIDHTGHVMLHMDGTGEGGAYLSRDGDADPL